MRTLHFTATRGKKETSRASDVLGGVHLLLPLRDDILDLGPKHFVVAQDSCVTGTFEWGGGCHLRIDIYRVALCGSCQYIMFMNGVNLDLSSARGEARAER